jgi:hypothetical protein
MKNSHKTSARKPERKRALGKPRLRWEENTNMDLKETGREVHSTESGYDPVEGTYKDGSEPFGFTKGEEEFLDQLRDYQLLKNAAPWSMFIF